MDVINSYVEVWNTQQTEKLKNIFSKAAYYKDPLQEGEAIAVLSKSIKEQLKPFQMCHLR